MNLHKIKGRSFSKGPNPNPVFTLKKSQQRLRMKKEVDEVRRKLDEIPEKVQKTTWYHIMKDPALYEQDVIEMINDTNLSDRQFLTLFKLLKQKWGKGIVTKNITNKLIERKGILDTLFTKVKLDSKTDLHFKSTKNKILSRTIVYCHDLPGLVAFRKLIENKTDFVR